MQILANELLKCQFLAPIGSCAESGKGTVLTTNSTTSFMSNKVIIDSDQVDQLFFLLSKVSSILVIPDPPPFTMDGTTVAACDTTGTGYTCCWIWVTGAAIRGAGGTGEIVGAAVIVCVTNCVGALSEGFARAGGGDPGGSMSPSSLGSGSVSW